MRVLLAGGSGLIGRRLAQRLSHDGYEVIVLSRTPQQKRHLLPEDTQVFYWDGKTSAGWGHLLDRTDTTIINLAGHNLAATSRWTMKHQDLVRSSRIDSTRAIVEAIHHAPHRPSLLIQSSAVGYYGNTGEAIVTTATPPATDWRAQVCVEWENAAQDAGIRTIYLRMGIMLDTCGGAFPAFIEAAKFLSRQFGDGTQWIPWIHHADMIHSIVYLMNYPQAEGAYNLVAPNPVRNQSFMGSIGQVVGRPMGVPVPKWALTFSLGEISTILLDSQRIVPNGLQDIGYKFKFATLEPALRNLLIHGLKATDIAEPTPPFQTTSPIR